ncbi:putative transporter C3H1.06c [Grifola frondosa]|uniref:Putative transporter C3H1.06c n=1 Tax=Grifola frondosa TaxID=5627 RepID=A0A1C7MF68_GRIFR|nr:putative transporter C3H1.06c [Grifola frondosa]
MDAEKQPTVVPHTSNPEKAKHHQAWKEGEEHVLPKNNIPIVFAGLMACVFLAALDQTIVSTALPTIVAKLGGGKDYSWVGSAYLLASSALSPIYGKLSDIVGRKPVLYSSIFIFLLGSALCGAAQSMIWLVYLYKIVASTAGLSVLLGASLVSSDLSWVEFSPIIYHGDGASSLICTPTGGVGFALLFFFLNLNPHHGKPFRQHVQEFDFLGLILIIGGVVLILIGFNFSETAWNAPETIAPLVIGICLLIAAAFNELYTKRSAIMPPRLFKTRTTAIILITVFLHAFAFFTGTYYLPVYFQVLGSSATGAGVRMLPFSLSSAAFSAISGQIITRTGRWRPIIETSNTAEKVLYPLVTALGIGCLFQTPLIGLQAAMPLRDMATSTASFVLLRTLGGTVGISIGQAILTSVLRKKIAEIPGLTIDTSAAALNDMVRQVKDIPNVTQRIAVMQAYSKAISTIWLVNTPVVGVGFILVFFLRAYTLKRVVIKAGEQTHADVESGAAEAATGVAQAPPESADTRDDAATIHGTIRDSLSTRDHTNDR